MKTCIHNDQCASLPPSVSRSRGARRRSGATDGRHIDQCVISVIEVALSLLRLPWSKAWEESLLQDVLEVPLRQHVDVIHIRVIPRPEEGRSAAVSTEDSRHLTSAKARVHRRPSLAAQLVKVASTAPVPVANAVGELAHERWPEGEGDGGGVQLDQRARGEPKRHPSGIVEACVYVEIVEDVGKAPRGQVPVEAPPGVREDALRSVEVDDDSHVGAHVPPHRLRPALVEVEHSGGVE
mmetsp:Transcript_12349/g.41439  ORF Transcript_12349/g.41439 Transcript_12349/m.41439 type:complete len:238 (+) Transcript_12349:327-1040(+)